MGDNGPNRLNSQADRDAEFALEKVDGVNNSLGKAYPNEVIIEDVGSAEKQADLPIENRHPRCNAVILIVRLTNKVGTPPTKVDIRIYDQNKDAITSEDDGNVIIRRLQKTINGATLPDEIINEEIIRPFITKNTQGVLGISIKHTGGDGTTFFDYGIQLFGKVLG